MTDQNPDNLLGSLRVLALDPQVDADWRNLAIEMQGTSDGVVVARILRQLRDSGAQSAIIENDYLDRDFSAEYSGFYSKLFARYQRFIPRIHFFRSRLQQAGILGVRDQLISVAKTEGDYLGFIVQRSVEDAPIGRTIIAAPPHLSPFLEVRSTYKTHLLGVALSVAALPFVQQDNRVSSCAQTSVWICGRHFENRHGGPWKSTVDITTDATNPTDGSIAQSLPPAAEWLEEDHIIRALFSMGRRPFCYREQADQLDPTQVNWDFQPAEVVARYVCSGIPVILGLDETGEPVGHSVVVHGCVFNKDADLAGDELKPWSRFLTHFIVHDDRLGPNLIMPIARPADDSDEARDKRIEDGGTPYNLDDYCTSITLPLPNKVFCKAEYAEEVAWAEMVRYAAYWPQMLVDHKDTLGAVDAFKHVAEAIEKCGVVARTTLTMGWKYQRRILESTAAKGVKERVAALRLPRMVWVTEFGLPDQLRNEEPAERRVFGHCVVDATSTGLLVPMISHAPGLVWYDVLRPSEEGGTRTRMVPIPNDQPYAPRHRKAGKVSLRGD